jgi:hypothetical protein
MIKYGLEKELFLLDKDNKPIIIRSDMGLPYDECGFLLEARGAPHKDIYEAVYSLKAEEKRIQDKVYKLNSSYQVLDMSIFKISRDFKREVKRIHTKGLLTFQNIYGFKDNRHSRDEATAAVHISFTNFEVFTYRDKDNQYKEFLYNSNFDYIKYFTILDKAFKDEIKKAKRNPGFYELKANGRIEYRSLPSDVDLMKVIEVINNIK